MTDGARRAYVALGRGFVVLGLAVAALAVADGALDLGLFDRSPFGSALFLAVVGGLLLWTVRQADAQRAQGAPPADVGDDVDAPPERPEDARVPGDGSPPVR